MEILKKYYGFILAGLVIYFIFLMSKPDSIYNRAKELSAFKREVYSCIPKDTKNFNFEKTVLSLNAIFDPLFNRAEADELILRLAEGVKAKIDGNADPQELMDRFNSYLFNDYGFVFDKTANTLLYQGAATGGFSEDDFLNYQSIPRVINRRQGICLSLTTIFLMIGERLNLPIYGVIVPGHVFVRYQDATHSGINSETTAGGAEFYGYKGLTNTEFVDNPQTMYNKPLDKYTVLAAILNNFSIMYTNRKDYDRALILLKKSVEMAPYFPETRTNLGLTYARIRKFKDSRKELEESIRLFPGSPVTELVLGLLYIGEKEYIMAEEHLNKALKNELTAKKAAEALEELKKARGY